MKMKKMKKILAMMLVVIMTTICAISAMAEAKPVSYRVEAGWFGRNSYFVTYEDNGTGEQFEVKVSKDTFDRAVKQVTEDEYERWKEENKTTKWFLFFHKTYEPSYEEFLNRH